MGNMTGPQWIIVITVVGLWIFFGINMKKIVASSPATKKKNKAINMGHTVVGVCIQCEKSSHIPFSSQDVDTKGDYRKENRTRYDLVFEYYVNGTRYIYKTLATMPCRLGSQLTLYYYDNPGKVFEDPHNGATPSLIFVFIPLIVGVLLTLLFRYLGLM